MSRLSYGDFLKNKFGGIKVQKISVNAGFSCPNRDGTIGYGGCIYCNNRSFTPSYCFESKEIKKQIESGVSFFSNKYPEMKYLPYFQSYSNTFTGDLSDLRKLYLTAIDNTDVVGLIIGTRPDCLPTKVLDILSEINEKKPVIVELGAETSHNETLKIINRGHNWECVVEAVERLNNRNIGVGLHLICGLPGEEEDKILQTVERSSSLAVETLKFHHLQILKDTRLHNLWESGQLEIRTFSLDEYIDLCIKIVNLVPENIVIERFLSTAPPDMVISPKWGLKNYEFMNILNNRLKL